MRLLLAALTPVLPMRSLRLRCWACDDQLGLQVLDLGITRDLGKRLVQVFPSMCAGDHPVCGSFSATYAEAYRRLMDLGRRCKASRVKPG